MEHLRNSDVRFDGVISTINSLGLVLKDYRICRNLIRD